MGGEAERRLHFRHGPPPPQGKGDAVSRVWALSPPGTTDWAAFGRRVSGAWSVAWSPPPPPAHGTSAEGVRVRSHPLTLRSHPRVPHAFNCCLESRHCGTSRGLLQNCPPRPHLGNAPGKRRCEGVIEVAAKPTPVTSKKSGADNRPCAGWPSAYRAAGALDDGHAPPSSRTNPCSGRVARTKGAKPTAAAVGRPARR